MDPNALAGQISTLDQSYNPTDTYNKITTQLGIPDARTRVQALQSNLLNTQNAINAVDPGVTARTSGQLVTEAQRGRLVNMEKAPLTTTAGTQSQDLNQANNNLNSLTGQAGQQATLAESNYKTKRQSLADQLSAAIATRDKAQAQANADRAFNAQQEQQKITNSQNQQRISNTGSGRGGGAQVNPAQDFLDYIGGQFKASGGQGNSGTTRQTQDSWANAWFDKNGVSNANRQQYWNLFNKTYNRSDDPTKDWRYKQ